MSFEKVRILLDYPYNHVTKTRNELRKLSKMPKATFYRNLEKLSLQSTIKRRQGSGRPGSRLKRSKINQPKSPHSPLKSTLQIKREFQTSRRSVNVSKSTVYRTSRKSGTKNHVSASEIAYGFDTWTIPTLHRCMWKN